MKTHSFILSGLILSLMLMSCKKFVDIKKSSSQFFMTTANDCQLMLDNYAKMNTGYPIDGEISADDYYITGASYQAPVAQVPQEEKDLYTWDANAQRLSSTPNWLNPYQVVYNANLILETLDRLKGSNEDPKLLNTLRGSALFYRAYCFWNVAQLYAKPYTNTSASQDPGIPLRLNSDINDESTRGTVQGTYERIIQDLNDAVNLLPNTSSVPTRPNKTAAYAMLARTYLSMEDYPKALINAKEALRLNDKLIDYNSISKTSGTPFLRFNDEVIFHSVSYSKSGTGAAGLIVAPGRANSSMAKIDSDLVASYAVNDLRRRIFLKENTTSNIPNRTFRFTGNYENAGSTSVFFTGLAVDEMYLISSECQARAGQFNQAMTELNTLLKKRWLTNSYVDKVANNTEEALDIILAERRKELLMRGLRWTDLRRLKKSITRKITIGTGPSQVTTTYTLAANDPRYTLLLPKELMDNTNFSQNPR